MEPKNALPRKADLTYKIFLHLVAKVEMGKMDAGIVDTLMTISEAAAQKILTIK